MEPTIRLPPTVPVDRLEPATCESTVSQQDVASVLQGLPSSLQAESGSKLLFGDTGVARRTDDTEDVAMCLSRAVTAELEALLPQLQEAAKRPDGCPELVDAAIQLAGAADELQRALQHHQRSL